MSAWSISINQPLEAVKITRSEAEGRGLRLAYQLEDGSMVYLPDEGN